MRICMSSHSGIEWMIFPCNKEAIWRIVGGACFICDDCKKAIEQIQRNYPPRATTKFERFKSEQELSEVNQGSYI